jgi:hypothetical protein|tara:strand:+ start:569 stop:697 length:129 start_codon:yes stop_codon:yes gene_type:complete
MVMLSAPYGGDKTPFENKGKRLFTKGLSNNRRGGDERCEGLA